MTQDRFMNIIDNFNFSMNASLTGALTAIFLTFFLSIIITQIYKLTYRGRRYSQSYVHTIIIMSVVVSIIMIVIGNNIAVAFGLVGAFSIIRFRSAMSDPKDIAFIFFGMASGIACGLGFYLLAIVFTVSLGILIYIIFTLDYAKKEDVEKTLKITVPENLHYEGMFDDIFPEYLDRFYLVSVETTNLGTMYQLEYSVISKEGTSDKDLMDAIREKNANLKVSIGMPRATFYQ